MLTWLDTFTSVQDKLPVLYPQYILSQTQEGERGLEPSNVKHTKSSVKIAEIFKSYQQQASKVITLMAVTSLDVPPNIELIMSVELVSTPTNLECCG